MKIEEARNKHCPIMDKVCNPDECMMWRKSPVNAKPEEHGDCGIALLPKLIIDVESAITDLDSRYQQQ